MARPARTRLVGASLAGAALLLGSAPARAEKGMPQLDFGNPLMLAQIVWLAIIFYVLYRQLSRWALPAVAEVLEKRAAVIATDLEAARGAKAGADAAVAEFTAATRDAQAGAQAQIAEAVASAKAATDRDSAILNARLDAQIAQAERRIGEARTTAFGALEQVAVETATLVVSRLTGNAIDHAAVPRAVAGVIAARAQA